MQRLLMIATILGGLFLLQNTMAVGSWWGAQAKKAQAAASAPAENLHQSLPVTDSPEDVRTRHAVRLALEQERRSCETARKPLVNMARQLMQQADQHGLACDVDTWIESGVLKCTPKQAHGTIETPEAEGFQPVPIN